MTAELKAQVTLKLNDQLSDGIKALQRRLQSLTGLFQKLSRLSALGETLRADKLVSQLKPAEGALDAIRKKADGATEALRRLGQQKIMVNSAGTAFLPPSVTRGLMAATVAAAIGASSGGAGGRMPAIPDASFFDGPQLRLGGPGGGAGIPLSFNPALMQLGALRAGLRGVAGQAQQLNHHLREAGHGALGALTTGFGLFEPVREYAAYENTARHIAITENIPQADLPKVIHGLTQQFDKLAMATGQNAEKVAESANFLITTGIGKAAVDTMLPIIAQAATAYNTNIGDSVQAVFALKENLHVRDEDLGTAVSSGALAAKQGHFSFQDMSRYLPAVAPIAAMSGLSGLGGAQELMASLETSRRNAGTSEEAFVNYRDYLSHLFGDPKRGLAHGFQKGYGVDLNKVLLDAEKQGISAPEAVIAQVKQLVKGKTAYETNLIIGSLFKNQQSASYVRGRIADDKYFNGTRDKLQGTDPDTIQNDFLKAFDAPQIQLNRLQEALKQIVRRFGEGFAGLVPPITRGLEAVIALFAAIDASSPGAVNKVLGITGGFLALMATLGILLPMYKLVGAGFLLLDKVALLAKLSIAKFEGAMLRLLIAGGPILWILGAIALAALLIWYNWDKLGPRFAMLWADLKDSFGQFGTWLKDVATQWLAPFDTLIKSLGERIETLRRMLGGGPTEDPHASRNGRRDRDDSVEFDGKPSLGGVPELRQNLDDEAKKWSMSYHPSGGGGQNTGRVGFDPIEISVKVDGPARVDAPQRIQPINRGPILYRV